MQPRKKVRKKKKVFWFPVEESAGAEILEKWKPVEAELLPEWVGITNGVPKLTGGIVGIPATRETGSGSEILYWIRLGFAASPAGGAEEAAGMFGPDECSTSGLTGTASEASKLGMSQRGAAGTVLTREILGSGARTCRVLLHAGRIPVAVLGISGMWLHRCLPGGYSSHPNPAI